MSDQPPTTDQPSTQDPVTDVPPSQQIDGEQPTTTANDAQQSEQAGGNDDDDDGEDVQKYSMSRDLYDQLAAQGFTDVAIKKSIIAGCIDAKTCQTWIEMHLDFPQLNDPLEPNIRFKIREKHNLTDAEREAKVQELKEKIAAKKAAEAQAATISARNAELQRIADAKEAALAKEERERRERELVYAERKKDKERDRLAKEKVLLEMAIDKYVRAGHPTDEARRMAEKDAADRRERQRELALKAREEAEKQERDEEERRKARGADGSGGGGGEWNLGRVLQNSGGATDEEIAAAARAGRRPPPADDPSSQRQQQHGGIQQNRAASDLDVGVDISSIPTTVAGFTGVLAQAQASLQGGEQAAQVFMTCLSTLELILSNIVANPTEGKFRAIKTTSMTFSNKIANVKFACAFLRLAGFQEDFQVNAATGQVDQMFAVPFLVVSRLRNALTALTQMKQALSSG